MATPIRKNIVSDKMAQKKKSTGPTSEVGKSVSSKNALTHGATSAKFLDDAEHDRYFTILEGLETHYPNPNPLIQMQLERIARLNIQLERIQNTIDAQFKRSRLLSNIYEAASKSLNMDDETKSAAMNAVMGFGEMRSLVSKNAITVDLELNELINSDRPKSYEDFLLKTPKFCRYLFEEAMESQLTIRDFIAQKIPQTSKNLPDHYPNRPDSIKITFIYETYRDSTKLPEDFETQFRNTSLDEIKRAAEWYAMGISRIFILTQKIGDFLKLTTIEEQATTPDLDQLDRLMRYQTTIQRQLSTAIGELLALTKV